MGAMDGLGRILVVDDSPSSRRLLQDVLLHLGVTLPNLRVASTIPEALVAFSQWRPEVAIVDIELSSGATPATPGTPPPSPNDPKDGAELVSLFRKRNPAIKVLVCSATDPTDPRLQQLGRGPQLEFITKPVLAARLEDVLAGFTTSGAGRART
jgi:CheY-like chemotaxis protein